MTRVYAETARRAGDSVLLLEPAVLDHFDVVDPAGPAFALIADAARALA